VRLVLVCIRAYTHDVWRNTIFTSTLSKIKKTTAPLRNNKATDTTDWLLVENINLVFINNSYDHEFIGV